ncbi:MAG TPA: LytTR family DNA-binding domain-containing protein [Thermoanaerobaculia bacterium]|nr:LytTR family DNA-binding domain-containing protein [Thermoanaerobaculia bacterium]
MNDARPLRVLIVDDELLARQRLEDLLAREENVEIVGMIDNGRDAVNAIQSHNPDLIFLDIQMPGLTGLEVAKHVGVDRMPTTIFVTAFDHHAIKAFDLAAIDYLVKPFDDERFATAFRRARKLIELEEVERMTRRLVTLLQGSEAAGAQASPSPAPSWLERISVETRGQLRVVPVEKIDYITASGPYAELHVADRTHAVRERMQTLEERLDPDRFFRIHRSAIVRLDTIEAILRGPGGDYAVRLKNGTELSLSRARREELEQKMGVAK